MANKARYYGISTREEQQDMADKSRGARVYPTTLGYRAIKAAILNYKDESSDFDELSAIDAAKRIASRLTNTGLYGKVSNQSAKIVGEHYSISLTKHHGMITPSRATEKTDEEDEEKKRGRV